MVRRARKALVVSLASSVLAAVVGAGCNALTGLNDYEKVDCVGLGCVDASTDAEFDASDVRETTPDSDLPEGDTGEAETGPGPADAPDGPLVTRARRWAQWRMPHMMPLDAGEDALPPGVKLASYQVQADDTVLDRVTGLVWERDGTTEAASIEAALHHCAGLPAAGAARWGVPTRIELASLIDPSRSPAIDREAFPETAPVPYWTLSEKVGAGEASPKYWTVDFHDGRVSPSNSPAARRVRCVRVD